MAVSPEPKALVHIIIGLKRLAGAKQRLGNDLDPGERRRLMLRMLASAVRAALAARRGDVWLATSEPSAGQIATQLGISVVSDGDLPWNEGLVYALRQLSPRPGVLYLAGDLPLVTPAEIAAFVDGAPPRGIAVARARDGGTNALLVRPPQLLRPHFGTLRSSLVHAAAAARQGIPCHSVDIDGLALDIDTFDDLQDAGLTAVYLARPHSDPMAAAEHTPASASSRPSTTGFLDVRERSVAPRLRF